ncbi:D-aminoacyl-tRNA deacylase [Listeria sp. PSOL-1]|uniref:D-aminoacyl-tRNA deacylase n=1 Tax=Listeria sp. PSOL-1 TaxID=1844999 RepID=UPI0013D0F706|nr:D-aminoacyl-tRNA deacylase [Listeria sp. PSOL-1]
MRVLIQRCLEASVTIDDEVIAEIAQGLTLFVGVTHQDTEKEVDYLVKKISSLRIFEDEAGKMNRSITEIEGDILSVSQFTLYADAKKGRRPSFIQAAEKEQAEALYELLNEKLEDSGIGIGRGVFGADMDVRINNHGPVTIMLDTEELLD